MPAIELSRLTDYSPDDLGVTLIRWMLSLTPAERLQVAQQTIDVRVELEIAPELRIRVLDLETRSGSKGTSVTRRSCGAADPAPDTGRKAEELARSKMAG